MNWLKKIGFKAQHSAFVDLCEFKQQLFCCYREAKDHVSDDGAVRILTLDFDGNVSYSNKVHLPHTDLRDPKLSVMPNGHLLLIAYGRHGKVHNKPKAPTNLCWVSQTGHSWSASKEYADKGWWLWRVRWHQEQAYGFAYNRGKNAINLHKGNPRRSFHMHQPSALSLDKHGKGYPNESDLLFDKSQAFALVRRDADSYSAQLGHSIYPFKKWKWIDLGIYIGGPVMLRLDANHALVAGRVIKKKKLVTALMKMRLSDGKLVELAVLPSGGDNSYAGLVMKDQTLYVSYYSSHEGNKTCVYLAKFNAEVLLNT